MEEQAVLIVDQVCEGFGADAVVARLLEGDALVLLASRGIPGPKLNERMRADDGIAGRMMQERRAFNIRDVATDPVTGPLYRADPSAFRFRSFCGAPMLVSEDVVGILGIYSIERPDAFTDADCEHLQIVANHVAAAIVNAQMLARLQRFNAELEQRVAQRTEQLAVSEQRYRVLADHASDMIARHDAQGRYMYVSPSAKQILGFEPGELLGVDPYQQIHPDDVERTRASFQRVIDGGEACVCSYRYRRKDGRYAWVETTKQSIHAPHSPTGFELIAVSRDVTRRREAEELSRVHREELAHVSRLSTMGEMASGLAHELNQPLAVIANYAHGALQRLGASRLDEPMVADVLGKIAAQAERAGAVIKRLRAFVSKRPAQQARADLHELVAEVLVLVEPEMREHEVRIETVLHPYAPPVRADAIQIQQVILNLLRNSAEAVSGLEEARRTVRVATRPQGRGGVELTVTDRGTGLDEEQLAHLFDPFFTTKPEGMGMGLTISHSIMEAHAGRLWATRNTDGPGVTLHLWLPGLHAGLGKLGGAVAGGKIFKTEGST